MKHTGNILIFIGFILTDLSGATTTTRFFTTSTTNPPRTTRFTTTAPPRTTTPRGTTTTTPTPSPPPPTTTTITTTTTIKTPSTQPSTPTTPTPTTIPTTTKPLTTTPLASTPVTPSTTPTPSTSPYPSTTVDVLQTTSSKLGKCTGGNDQVILIMLAGKTLQKTPATSSAIISGVTDIRNCEQICLNGTSATTCKSFTYSAANRRCQLNPYRRGEPGVTLVDNSTAYTMQWECHSYNPYVRKWPNNLYYCNDPSTRFVFRLFTSKKLNIATGKSISNIQTDSNCQDQCVSDNTCHSINFRQTPMSCVLNNIKRKDVQEAAFEDQNTYQFYEKFCIKDPLGCSSNRFLTWYARTGMRPLSTNAVKVIQNVPDLLGCRTLCVHHTDPSQCSSLLYNVTERSCSLFDVTPDANITDADTHFMEWKCQESRATDCGTNSRLEWNYFPQKILPGRDDVIINNIADASVCQARCLAWADYVCKAVKYDAQNKVCVLLSLSRAEVSLVDKQDPFMHYFEWTCKLDKCPAGQNKIWFETPNAYLDQKDYETIPNAATFYQCHTHCLNKKTFSCRSFEYSDQTLSCRLSRWSASDTFSGKLTKDETSGYRFVEWRCRPYNISIKCNTTERFLWVEMMSHYHVAGAHRTFGSKSYSECEQECAMDSSCASLDYSRSNSVCDLAQVDQYQAGGLRSNNNFVYLERRCTSGPYNPCDVQQNEEVYWAAFLHRRFEAPPTANKKSRNNISSLVACEYLCIKTKFTIDSDCLSVEYNTEDKTCDLFNQTAPRDGLKNVNGSYGYFERKCRSATSLRCTSGTSTQAILTENMRAVSHSFSISLSGLSSWQACATKCYGFSGYSCQSFDYSLALRDCILHPMNVSQDNLVTDNRYSHYSIACRAGASTGGQSGLFSMLHQSLVKIIGFDLLLTFVFMYK